MFEKRRAYFSFWHKVFVGILTHLRDKVPSKMLNNYTNVNHNTTKVNASGSTLSEQQLRQMLIAAPYLNEINLDNTILPEFNIDDIEIYYLKRLLLNGSTITAAGLGSFLLQAPYIIDLDISNCKLNSFDAGTMYLPYLAFLTALGPDLDKCITELLKAADNLGCLDVSLSGLADLSSWPVMRNLKSLRIISVIFDVNDPKIDLAMLAQKLPNLEILVIDCHMAQIFAATKIEQLTDWLPGLRSISLNTNKDSDHIAHHVLAISPNLQKLTITSSLAERIDERIWFNNLITLTIYGNDEHAVLMANILRRLNNNGVVITQDLLYECFKQLLESNRQTEDINQMLEAFAYMIIAKNTRDSKIMDTTLLDLIPHIKNESILRKALSFLDQETRKMAVISLLNDNQRDKDCLTKYKDVKIYENPSSLMSKASLLFGFRNRLQLSPNLSRYVLEFLQPPIEDFVDAADPEVIQTRTKLLEDYAKAYCALKRF